MLDAHLSLLRGCTHASIEQDGLSLVAHDHNIVAVRINSPTRVVLYHGQEVINYHAIADINSVHVAAFL